LGCDRDKSVSLGFGFCLCFLARFLFDARMACSARSNRAYARLKNSPCKRLRSYEGLLQNLGSIYPVDIYGSTDIFGGESIMCRLRSDGALSPLGPWSQTSMKCLSDISVSLTWIFPRSSDPSRHPSFMVYGLQRHHGNLLFVKRKTRALDGRCWPDVFRAKGPSHPQYSTKEITVAGESG